jgi:arsenate reductase
LKKVLFVCIGNCIRSQMAEAFAVAYGRDVIKAYSAGVAPAGFVSEIAVKLMGERGIAMVDQFSKSIPEAAAAPYDLVINMSGEPIPAFGLAKQMRTWDVADPMGKKESAYQQAARQIEGQVMALILELRRASRPATTSMRRPQQTR